MALTYINPYSFIAADYVAGMNSVGGVLAPLYPNQTIDALANAVYDFVVTTYMEEAPPPLQAKSLKSSIYAILNSYLNIENGEAIQLNALQMAFVFDLVDGTLELKNPEDIKQHIINVEERITTSKLSVPEQMPLLYATAVGKSAYDYWSIKVTTPGDWANFITSFTPAINKFPFWVTSSMQGTLIGLSNYQNSLNGKFAAELQVLLNYVGANTILALFGSLSVGAGKVVFNLQYRPIPFNICEETLLQEAQPNCGCK